MGKAATKLPPPDTENDQHQTPSARGKVKKASSKAGPKRKTFSKPKQKAKMAQVAVKAQRTPTRSLKRKCLRAEISKAKPRTGRRPASSSHDSLMRDKPSEEPEESEAMESSSSIEDEDSQED